MVNARVAKPSELLCFGISLRDTPGRLRDALSFGPDELAAVLRAAGAEQPGLEAAILSTCHRTELYLASPDPDPLESWLPVLERFRPPATLKAFRSRGARLMGETAVTHLARVAAGLESPVLGDMQVHGQVKRALQIAAAAGTLGRELQRAFTTALRASRRARAETDIAHGSPSVGSAVAGLLRARGPGTVLVIGAGEVAGTIGERLGKLRAANLVFVNRTYARAHALAQRCGGRAAGWGRLAAALAEADVVVVAVRAPRPVLRCRALERAAARRPERRLLVVDASVPRAVEASPVVDLVDIDAVKERQHQSLSIRRAAVPAAERAVDAEVREWVAWRARRPVEMMIRTLYREAEMLSHREAPRLRALPDGDAQEALLAAFRRLLHPHVTTLRTLGAVLSGGGRTGT